MPYLFIPLACVSLYGFSEPKVDESEIVHYAVAMLVGDIDPRWDDGYGHITMYVFAFLYWLAGIFYIVVGKFGNLAEFAETVFSTSTFFVVGRLLCATALISAITVYCRLQQQQSRAPLLVACFAAFTCLSPEVLTYSNYVRSDAFLALYVAFIALVATQPATRRSVSIAVALASVATATKVSAASLYAVPALLCVEGLIHKRIRFRDCAIFALIAISVLVACSPFLDYLGLIQKIFERNVIAEERTALRDSYTSLGARLASIYSYFRASLFGHDYLLGFVPVAMWLDPRMRRIGVVLAIFVAPFLLANSMREYWLLPAYPGIKLLIVAGVFATVQRVSHLARLERARLLAAGADAMRLIKIADAARRARPVAGTARGGGVGPL